MWQGRLLQALGIWLVVAALGHYGVGANTWINVATGIVVAVVGLYTQKLRPWLGLAAVAVGLALVVVAFVPHLMYQSRQVRIDGLAGLVVWFCGWRTVAGETRGPWSMKNRPTV